MNDILSSTPAARPFFINRESHENRESLGDANRSSIRWIATIWFHIIEVVHCEQYDLLR
jgi:hypothetical protein